MPAFSLQQLPGMDRLKMWLNNLLRGKDRLKIWLNSLLRLFHPSVPELHMIYMAPSVSFHSIMKKIYKIVHNWVKTHIILRLLVILYLPRYTKYSVEFYEQKIQHLDRICNIWHHSKLHIQDASFLIILLAFPIHTLCNITIQHLIWHSC